MLCFLTAGESHGPCLTAIIEGMPAGLALSEGDINVDLRRQGGYGRGKRMEIERDQAQILSGVIKGFTIGAPITLGLSDVVPHFLFGGWTGSGKTYALRSAVAQLSGDPENRLVLIDAKWGDGLGCLGRLPHLAGPVAVDVASAKAALSWAVAEMRRRQI